MSAIVLTLAFVLTACYTKAKSECLEPQDLAIVLDGASSVCHGDVSGTSCPHWDSYRQFIHKLVGSMTIGPDDVRVSVVTFSDVAHVQWGLDKYLHVDKASLQSAIDEIAYPGGERNTSGALRILLTEVFASSDEERPNITKSAIVITNGMPTVASRDLADAVIDLQYAEVITYVIGVTKEIHELLPRLMSSPDQELGKNYFLVKDFDSIGKVRKDLQKAVCGNN